MELNQFQAMGALLIWSLKLVVDPRLRPRPGDGLVGSHGGNVMLGGSSHDLDTWLKPW